MQGLVDIKTTNFINSVSILATVRYNHLMRVISEKALRAFWKAHPDAEQALRTWLALVSRAAWRSPDDIKRDFASASFLANNRVVFNIRDNNYRLVVLALYKPGYLYIRFIGTHAEYDRIDAENV